jgi:hypothetical protein
MIVWLYCIDSDKDYHNLIDFLKRFDEQYGLFFYVVDGALKLKNGNIFGDIKRKNVIIRFTTGFLYFKKKYELIESMHPSVEFYIIKESDNILPSSLIRLTDLDEGENKKLVSFMSEYKLIDYLKNENFKFLDDSRMTKYNHILGY